MSATPPTGGKGTAPDEERDRTSGSDAAELACSGRQLASLAAPIAGVQFAQVALTSTDLAMMGLISVPAIAAGGLAAVLYNLTRTMSVGMVTAVGNMVAGAAGRGEARAGAGALDDQARAEVRGIVRAAFLVATSAAVLAAGALVALGFLLPLLGQDAGLAAQARPMMAALAPGLVPMVWLNVLRQFAVGMRRPGSLLAVTVASIGANVALNFVFIYGWLGAPALGLAGIGLSTSFVQLLSAAAFYRMLRRDPVLAPLISVDGWNAEPGTARAIARSGVPIALTYGSEAGIASTGAVLMGAFGPVVLAAHNVATQLTRVAFQISVGLSQGSSILVSRAVGKGDEAEVRRTAAAALALGALATGLIGLLYLVAPAAALRPFLGPSDSAAAAFAAVFLIFAVLQQVVDFAQNIAVGLLRGVGNTTAGLTATLAGYWGAGLPAMWLLAFHTPLREKGIWVGLSVGFAVAAAILLRKFFRSLPPRTPAPARPDGRERPGPTAENNL